MEQNENNPQIVFSWSAPLRPYKKRSSFILRFYLAIGLLTSCIVFFFGDKILIIPIGALLFLFYVLTITPPPEVQNKITKFGIDAAGVILRWEGLSQFYFKKRFGFEQLVIVGKPPYFYHAYLVIPNEQVKKTIKTILLEHLIYMENPRRSFSDKAADWLSLLIPDEEDHQVAQPTPKATPLSPQTTAPTL